MAELLHNMMIKAEKDGLTGRLKSALDTASAVKLDCEQRFLDDQGAANECMCVALHLQGA